MEFTFQVASRTVTSSPYRATPRPGTPRPPGSPGGRGASGSPPGPRSAPPRRIRNPAMVGRMDVDARLRELGIELPTPKTPAGNSLPAVRAGDLVHLSGTGPVRADGSMVTGKVGDGGLDVDAARDAARLTGLQLLAALKAELG